MTGIDGFVRAACLLQQAGGPLTPWTRPARRSGRAAPVPLPSGMLVPDGESDEAETNAPAPHDAARHARAPPLPRCRAARAVGLREHEPGRGCERRQAGRPAAPGARGRVRPPAAVGLQVGPARRARRPRPAVHGQPRPAQAGGGGRTRRGRAVRLLGRVLERSAVARPEPGRRGAGAGRAVRRPRQRRDAGERPAGRVRQGVVQGRRGDDRGRRDGDRPRDGRERPVRLLAGRAEVPVLPRRREGEVGRLPRRRPRGRAGRRQAAELRGFQGRADAGLGGARRRLRHAGPRQGAGLLRRLGRRPRVAPVEGLAGRAGRAGQRAPAGGDAVRRRGVRRGEGLRPDRRPAAGERAVRRRIHGVARRPAGADARDRRRDDAAGQLVLPAGLSAAGRS